MTTRTYRLSEQTWQEHLAHRRSCNGGLCDHPAHHYAKAFADGRVLVEGVPVDADGRPLRPAR